MSKLKTLKSIIMLLVKALQKRFEAFICKQYKKIALHDLKLKTEVVRVKKGRSRYYLVFFATKEGNYRVNICRHYPFTNFNFSQNSY